MSKSILKEKSYLFATLIVKLSQYLQTEKKEYILSKQVLRSRTAIGALIKEAMFGQSKPDFIGKLNISVKEANETDYWLSLLKDTNYIKEENYKSLSIFCTQRFKYTRQGLQ